MANHAIENPDHQGGAATACRTRWEHPVAAVILLAFSVVAVLSISHRSTTYDERAHYGYGISITRLNSDLGLNDSKMPFSVVNTIPRLLSTTLNRHVALRALTSPLESFTAARIMTICFAVLLGWQVFRWSNALYGPHGAILSLLLYSLDPNILAHGALVTTDLFVSLMVMVALFRFWAFLKEPTTGNALWSAATLGLAQLSKYTAIYLYPLFVILLLFRGAGWLGRLRHHGVPAVHRDLGRIAGYAALFLVVSLFLINAGFLFNQSFRPLAAYDLNSTLFLALQRTPGVNRIPLPLPKPFVEGLDRVKYNETTGATFPGIYLRGQIRQSGGPGFRGFKTYYLWCYLLKVPLAIQCFIVLVLVQFFRRGHWRGWQIREAFLLIPVVFFLAYFSLFFTAQIGIRFILPIFPLLYVFCGLLLKDPTGVSRTWRGVYGALLLYLTVSVASYAPHFLSYFNELVWPRTHAYRFLADSNIDWGQSGWYLDRYVAQHPTVAFQPERPTSGRVIVSVNALVGLLEPERYRWLRENFEPVDHIGYSFLVYDVDEQRLADLKQSGRLPRSW